jgi:hypothetical protein
VRMYEDFAPIFGDKRYGCCITTRHSLTLSHPPPSFWPKTKWLPSHTHPTFLFHQLKIKLKGCHFAIIEVIEAQSQAVLKTLT